MYTEQQIKNRVDLLNKILASGSVAGSDGFYYKPVQSGNISSTPVPIQTATSDEYMDEESMLDKIVVGGTMCTAEIISLINTDNKDSVILSKILGGSKDCDKVKGGLIEGQATISSGMDGAILKFSNIKTKKYGYLPVKAIALNQKTSTSVLEGDIDHHILSRYVAPFFLSGIDFVGQAAMRSGSTVTTGVAGMTQSQAPLTDAQMLNVMMGGGARAVSQQLRQDINKTPPVTVTIDPKELQEQKIITVYFLNDLIEKDILKTNNSINMNNGGN
jgi:hypothetical protein